MGRFDGRLIEKERPSDREERRRAWRIEKKKKECSLTDRVKSTKKKGVKRNLRL